MDRLEKILQDARLSVLMAYGFYSSVLMQLEVKEDNRIPAAGTDGLNIYVNRDFMLKLSAEDVRTVLLHELLHIVLKHCLRRGGKNKLVWNIAADAVVNHFISKDGQGSALFKPIEALIRGMKIQLTNTTVEEVYHRLMEETKTIEGSSYDMAGDLKEEVRETEDGRSVEEKVDGIVSSAKARDSIPAGLEENIPTIPKAKINWKQRLLPFITSVKAGDFSWQRPNRTWMANGYHFPSIVKDKRAKIVFALDTSGSMNIKVLAQGLAEAYALATGAEGLFVQCDAEVAEVLPMEKICAMIRNGSFNIKGRGGTDFRPVFEYIEKEKINPSLLVFFTDTFGVFPQKKPRYPVVWIVTDSSGSVPWGVKIEL